MRETDTTPDGRTFDNRAGRAVRMERENCLGCQGGSVHHTCGCEPDANPTQQHRDTPEACDELDAWLDQLIDFASAVPPSKKRCIERIRRALSTGVPEAFRRTIAFAQEECQEPSVMHVSDMARLIRDYAQAELDRALAQSDPGRVPKGWKLVPKEPTLSMVIRGQSGRHDTRGTQRGTQAEAVYKAMLDAAPQPQEGESDE